MSRGTDNTFSMKDVQFASFDDTLPPIKNNGNKWMSDSAPQVILSPSMQFSYMPSLKSSDTNRNEPAGYMETGHGGAAGMRGIRSQQ